MKMPIVSGRGLIRILRKKGYFIKDQKGSHIHLQHATRPPVTVPNHKVVAVGTLVEILKATGLKREDL